VVAGPRNQAGLTRDRLAAGRAAFQIPIPVDLTSRSKAGVAENFMFWRLHHPQRKSAPDDLGGSTIREGTFGTPVPCPRGLRSEVALYSPDPGILPATPPAISEHRLATGPR